MDVAYLVKGYYSQESKEKEVFYVGQNPKRAFDYFEQFSKKAEIVVEVYVDGALVKSIRQ